ncbi:MAG: Fic family protein [Candidatus Aenigmarchaeota archaeon]|nr:Fic family protein [Candidatus Aenigmarchaeota archaeon]
MAHIVTKTKNNKKYHYLQKSVRIKNKVFTISALIGTGELNEKELNARRTQFMPKLIEKERELLNRHKFQKYAYLTRKKAKTIESISKKYFEKINPLNPAYQSYKEYFITYLTYNSNAIEGSTLNLSDVDAALNENIIPKNTSLQEFYEARNSKEAISFIDSYAGDLNALFIKEIHKILMRDILTDSAGQYRTVQVYIRGTTFVPPKPGEVEKKMNALISEYHKNKKQYHPFELAAMVHADFETIHPFVDGNGRVGRLIINYILTKNNIPPIIIEVKNRRKYLKILKEFQTSRKKEYNNMILFLYATLIKNMKDQKII